MRNDAKINDVIGTLEARDLDGTEPGNLVRFDLGTNLLLKNKLPETITFKALFKGRCEKHLLFADVSVKAGGDLFINVIFYDCLPNVASFTSSLLNQTVYYFHGIN